MSVYDTLGTSTWQDISHADSMSPQRWIRVHMKSRNHSIGHINVVVLLATVQTAQHSPCRLAQLKERQTQNRRKDPRYRRCVPWPQNWRCTIVYTKWAAILIAWLWHLDVSNNNQKHVVETYLLLNLPATMKMLGVFCFNRFQLSGLLKHHTYCGIRQFRFCNQKRLHTSTSFVSHTSIFRECLDYKPISYLCIQKYVYNKQWEYRAFYWLSCLPPGYFSSSYSWLRLTLLPTFYTCYILPAVRAVPTAAAFLFPILHRHSFHMLPMLCSSKLTVEACFTRKNR